MVTFNEYLKGILVKVIESYTTLSSLDDKPGELNIIKIELLKIKGFLHVIANKIDATKYHTLNIERLQIKANSYLKSYYFEKEIENVSSLYANDPNRIKNLRLMIIESLNDKKMIEDITELVNKI